LISPIISVPLVMVLCRICCCSDSLNFAMSIYILIVRFYVFLFTVRNPKIISISAKIKFLYSKITKHSMQVTPISYDYYTNTKKSKNEARSVKVHHQKMNVKILHSSPCRSSLLKIYYLCARIILLIL
jgi:hypothetical protein